MTSETLAKIHPFLDGMRTTAEGHIQAGHEHAPMVFLLSEREKTFHLDQIALVPTGEDDDERDLMAHAIGKLVADHDAYIYLCEGWQIILPMGTDLSGPLPRPSKHPDREEVLSIHFVSKLGEELSRLYKIDRTGEKPVLVHIRDSEEPAEGRCANFYRYGVPEPAGVA